MFVNKSLLTGSLSEAPLFVTWYQCLVTVLACYVLRQAARYLPGKISFPELDLDVNILKQVRMRPRALLTPNIAAAPAVSRVRRNDNAQQPLSEERWSLLLLHWQVLQLL